MVCSMSRGLGDLDFKEKHLMTCDPEIMSVELQYGADGFSIQVKLAILNYHIMFQLS